MRQKLLFLVALTLLSSLAVTVQAQWRLGVNGGATWNHYSVDKQYATDYRFDERWGGTAGLTAQYNFFDWLGLRAGAFFAQRNYRHTRGEYADRLDMRYENGKVLTDFEQRDSNDKTVSGIRTSKNYALADRIIRNTYKTLLSRGLKGCFIYCQDPSLGEYLKQRIELARKIHQ